MIPPNPVPKIQCRAVRQPNPVTKQPSPVVKQPNRKVIRTWLKLKNRSRFRRLKSVTSPSRRLAAKFFIRARSCVYRADGMQNTGFINAAAAAGYRRIDGWTQLTFNNGAGQSNTISVPVASGSVFLPDYPAAGLPIPEDAYSTYEFRGWADGNAAESGLTASESCTLPWNFTGSSVTSVTAVWQKSLRNMEEQTISANVAAPDGTHMLGVSITGNLPAGSGVSAEMIPVSDAQALVDSQLGEDNGSTVLYALDISILVDGEKFSLPITVRAFRYP